VTPFEHIGGEPGLTAIIDDLVERMSRDPMIGFLFERVNLSRLKRLEFEHAANHLGASIPYTGRDLQQAHRRHPIMGGHFGRRRQLLKQVLEAHNVPEDIREAWLATQDALRAQVTTDDITQCNDVAAGERARAERNEEPK
jgi:hemoglobin